MTFAPFVDWGKFLPNPAANVSERAKVQLPDGSQANAKTFKVNHSEAIIYPRQKMRHSTKRLLAPGNS